ncbi:MOSC domain-containing protein [Candidatus Mycobacterium wuenschmannii]|uniref:MOSC domain-containing protein n=1 Tax=Candidatus Mycobacterium wuenschmannii TaxID=3027808 RepID=A0ABY8VY75_9MYCO|nr:MOSC domain-containing protein [Candidatus Mycobacterium wuenschmannii]WIM87749.1 MOSC domain-containing protein [Candidatus Mycobacterium wuenschmannii]
MHVLSVNVARPRTNPDPRAQSPLTGIDKKPVEDAVAVRAPGHSQSDASGLIGDTIGNPKLHGGPDQAVYAYAREDLDTWQDQLGVRLDNGMFGENLTTVGVDLTQTRIGERWRIGSGTLLLEVTAPRTPCRTFASFLDRPRWIKTFTDAGVPGAYFRVLNPGEVRAGDAITIEYRPEHDVTIGLVFTARMKDPSLAPELLKADALSAELKSFARQRAT